ncbi:putative reverse transcriptase domain-containing protein [Tanacetum coccineum]
MGDNEEDILDILKSLVEECKAVYKGRQMETFKTDAVREVSSITSNDTVKEDDRPSRALPCQLPPKELSPGIFALPYTIGSFNLYVMADLGACVNIMPNSVFEYLKLTNLRKTDMLVGMADMKQQAPLGTVENVLVKIDKFVFPCDFVVIDMPRILGEMMVLGRPFLATIHAQIDVFNGKFSFGISKETSKGRADHLPDNERVTSRWHVCKPIRVFYDDGSGEDCGIWPTRNPDLSFCSGYEAVYGKGEHGMLKQ